MRTLALRIIGLVAASLCALALAGAFTLAVNPPYEWHMKPRPYATVQSTER